MGTRDYEKMTQRIEYIIRNNDIIKATKLLKYENLVANDREARKLYFQKRNKV